MSVNYKEKYYKYKIKYITLQKNIIGGAAIQTIMLTKTKTKKRIKKMFEDYVKNKDMTKLKTDINQIYKLYYKFKDKNYLKNLIYSIYSIYSKKISIINVDFEDHLEQIISKKDNEYEKNKEKYKYNNKYKYYKEKYYKYKIKYITLQKNIIGGGAAKKKNKKNI